MYLESLLLGANAKVNSWSNADYVSATLKNGVAVEKIVFNFHSLNEIFCLMLLPEGRPHIRKASVKAENMFWVSTLWSVWVESVFPFSKCSPRCSTSEVFNLFSIYHVATHFICVLNFMLSDLMLIYSAIILNLQHTDNET